MSTVTADTKGNRNSKTRFWSSLIKFDISPSSICLPFDVISGDLGLFEFFPGDFFRNWYIEVRARSWWWYWVNFLFPEFRTLHINSLFRTNYRNKKWQGAVARVTRKYGQEYSNVVFQTRKKLNCFNLLENLMIIQYGGSVLHYYTNLFFYYVRKFVSYPEMFSALKAQKHVKYKRNVISYGI